MADYDELMRPHRDEMLRLRAEAKRLERRTTRKIQRLYRERGAGIRGTRFDPRTGKSNNYTKAQLESYIEKLQTFNSRKTQFVGLARNEPLPKDKWDKFDKKQKQHSENMSKAFSDFANVKVPVPDSSSKNGYKLGDRSLGEQLAAMRPKYPVANSASNSAYDPKATKPNQVTSEKSLKKLEKNMDKKLSPAYLARARRDARKQFGQMVDMIGDQELRDKVGKLSDTQFDILWHMTKFSEATSLVYEMYKSKNDDPLPDNMNEGKRNVANQSLKNAKVFATWAQLEL